MLKRAAGWVIEAEPLLLIFAVPVLVMPSSYLWKAQRGLNAYDALGDPSLAWPGPLSYLALALIALPWLARAVRDGAPMRPTPLDLPIALFLATMALGLWAATDRAHSLNVLLGIEAGVAVYYGVWHWGCRGRSRRVWVLAGGLVAAGAALAVLGFMQTDWALAQRRGAAWLAPLHAQLAVLPKLGAKRLNASVIAGTLILLIPLAVAWLVAPGDRARTGMSRRGEPQGVQLVAPTGAVVLARAGLALAVALMLGYVLTAWSRGDLMALAATAALAILLGHRRWREALLGLSVGAGAAVLGLALLSPGTLSMLWERVYPARAAVWTRALYIIGDHPFTGAGLDNFRAVARNSYPYFNLAFDQTEHAHSWPLQAGVDGGLLGIAAVLWLAAAFYASFLSTKGTKNTKGKKEKSEGFSVPSVVRTGLLAGFTAFFIGSLYDNGTMSTPRGALLFWAFLGVAMVAGRNDKYQISNIKSHIAYPTSHIPHRISRNSNPGRRRFRLWWIAAVGAVAMGLLVWGWPGVVGRWHHNMACIQRNQGLYGLGLSDGERAARATVAVAGYGRALAVAPGLAAAHRNLGALYYGAATREETARNISRTTHLDFEPAAFFDGVEPPPGGYLPAALEHLERALQLAPRDVVAGYFLEQARSE